MPRLKRVFITGLTTTELEEILNKRFKEFVLQPECEVMVVKYRPVKIFIRGEIENPGYYVLNSNLQVADEISDNNFLFPTIFDAIKRSGGVNLKSDFKMLFQPKIKWKCQNCDFFTQH